MKVLELYAYFLIHGQSLKTYTSLLFELYGCHLCHLVSAAIWVGGGLFLGASMNVQERMGLMIKVGRRFNIIAIPSLVRAGAYYLGASSIRCHLGGWRIVFGSRTGTRTEKHVDERTGENGSYDKGGQTV